MISAVVVSHNEGHLLDACLSSLGFCEEIIVVDLESTDNTREVAEKYNANYIWHERVPVVEIIHAWIQDKTKFDWILITDPDEVCSSSLAIELVELVKTLPDDIGAINVPWRFYYKDHLLKGTQWGGIQKRVFIVNRNRFYFTEEVHRGRHLKSGMKNHFVKFHVDNFVHHYWMTSRKQLVQKHKRYLKKEGQSQYENGSRTDILKVLMVCFKEFYNSFFTKKGWRDGLTGVYLSFFWGWYNFRAKYELWKYQKIKD